MHEQKGKAMTPALQLSDEELRLLRVVVEAKLSALTVEIAHTDRRQFRELLQHESSLLASLVSKLDANLAGQTEATGYRRS